MKYYYDISENEAFENENDIKHLIEFVSKDAIESEDLSDEDIYDMVLTPLEDVKSCLLKSKLTNIFDNFYSFDGDIEEFKEMILSEENFEELPDILYI